MTMAHFYGGVHGNRGAATRLGDKKSGLTTFANGWGLGVDVMLRYCKETDEDVVEVTLTSGSNGWIKKNIGRFTTKDLKGE
jgi:hypothetical protein